MQLLTLTAVCALGILAQDPDSTFTQQIRADLDASWDTWAAPLEAAGTNPGTVYKWPCAPDAPAANTILLLPDTQSYIESDPPSPFVCCSHWPLLRTQFRYVANLRPAAVLHLGDMVNRPDRWDHWTAFEYALRDMSASTPLALALGNHDGCGHGIGCVPSVTGTQYFNIYFPVARFSGEPWWAGNLDDDNRAITFSAGGADFIVVSVEFSLSPQPAVLAWADAQLKAHPNKIGIVLQHAIIDGAGEWLPFGLPTFDALKNNANLKLVVCGHALDPAGSGYGEAVRVEIVDGRRITILMRNFQTRPDGGEGWMNLLHVSHSGRRVTLETHSPVLSVMAGTAVNRTGPQSDFAMALGTLGDVNTDGIVDNADLLAVLAAWGNCINCLEDVNGDHVVDSVDLLFVLGAWS